MKTSSSVVLATLTLRTVTCFDRAKSISAATVAGPSLVAMCVKSPCSVTLATCGMALMTLPGATLAMNRGDLLTVCCAACYAAHILTLNRYSATASFELLSTAQIGVSALLAWSLFRGMETPYIRWTPAVWAAIVITGVFATALAFTLQSWAQRYTTSTRTALIFMLEPVFAWITSYLLTGETLSARAAAGAGLILAGILVVEAKPFPPRGH